MKYLKVLILSYLFVVFDVFGIEVKTASMTEEMQQHRKDRDAARRKAARDSTKRK